MGCDIYAYLGYGFVVKEYDGEQDPLYDVLDELSEIKLPSNGDYELESNVIEEIIYDTEGVDCIRFGSNDYDTVAIVAKASVVESESWSCTPLRKPKFDPQWIVDLQNACKKIGLEYKDPEWLFGAYYSC